MLLMGLLQGVHHERSSAQAPASVQKEKPQETQRLSTRCCGNGYLIHPNQKPLASELVSWAQLYPPHDVEALEQGDPVQDQPGTRGLWGEHITRGIALSLLSWCEELHIAPTRVGGHSEVPSELRHPFGSPGLPAQLESGPGTSRDQKHPEQGVRSPHMAWQ